MSVESDKLRLLIDTGWPTLVSNADDAITQLQEQKAEYQNQIDAVEFAMDEAETDQTADLVAKGYDFNYYGPTYGDTTLSDFVLCSDDLMAFSYDTANSFTIAGDQTAIFTVGLEMLLTIGITDGVRGTVTGSSYDGAVTFETTVNFSGGPITASHNYCYTAEYEYLGVGWDVDANIISRITFFPIAWDNLNLELGLSGTYGLYDLLDKIDDAIALQQANKAKYTQFITSYEDYAT